MGGVRGAGDGLLSRVLSNGVPSALQGLTIVCGMGTSVAPALESPAIMGMTAEGQLLIVVGCCQPSALPREMGRE